MELEGDESGWVLVCVMARSGFPFFFVGGGYVLMFGHTGLEMGWSKRL